MPTLHVCDLRSKKFVFIPQMFKRNKEGSLRFGSSRVHRAVQASKKQLTLTEVIARYISSVPNAHLGLDSLVGCIHTGIEYMKMK